MTHHLSTRAFSLVELSIVLVILGLLTGGILGGQSLIRAAELRAVSTEIMRFQTAIATYQDKYLELPGDGRNATRFWLRQNGNADCVSNSGAGTNSAGVCDGNGNGMIDTAGASQASEMLQLWRHLAKAGLIEGDYAGIAPASSGFDVIAGTNIPRSRVSGGGYYINQWDNSMNTGDANYYALSYGNNLTVGAKQTAGWHDAPLFKAEEAWNIDTKMDDGKPGRGTVVIGFTYPNCTLAANATDFAADYRLNNTAVACSMRAIRLF